MDEEEAAEKEVYTDDDQSTNIEKTKYCVGINTRGCEKKAKVERQKDRVYCGDAPPNHTGFDDL